MKDFKQVMVTKPNAISNNDKATLSEQGIIVIEAEKPDEIKMLTFFDGVRGDDFIMSLIAGVEQSNYSKEKFTLELFKRIKGE